MSSCGLDCRGRMDEDGDGEMEMEMMVVCCVVLDQVPGGWEERKGGRSSSRGEVMVMGR